MIIIFSKFIAIIIIKWFAVLADNIDNICSNAYVPYSVKAVINNLKCNLHAWFGFISQLQDNF